MLLFCMNFNFVYFFGRFGTIINCIIAQMSKSKGKKGRGTQLSIFISKLVKILENQDIAQIISWTTSADSFNIKNITRFTEEVLPRYFKHRNFSSFIRQLNMYAFRKIRHHEGDNVYMNDNFKQGNRQLLKNIVRKVKEDKDVTVAIYAERNVRLEGMTSKEINELKHKQKNLEEMCKNFLNQNQRLMEQNQNLIRKMEQESKQKERRLQQFLIFLLAQNNKKGLPDSDNEPVLSITNQQYNPFLNKMKQRQLESGPTPLQILSNTLQQSDHMKYIKALLQEIYSKKQKKRDNSTIVQPTTYQSTIIPLQSNQIQNQLQQIHSIDRQDNDNKSFLSINDFLNVEDYDHDINLQASN